MIQNNKNTNCDMFFNFDTGSSSSERQNISMKPFLNSFNSEYQRDFRFDGMTGEMESKKVCENKDYISQSNIGKDGACSPQIFYKQNDCSDSSSSPCSISCFNSK